MSGIDICGAVAGLQNWAAESRPVTYRAARKSPQAHVLFFFGRRSIMDTMSRSFERGTNARRRAAEPILGADSADLRQIRQDTVSPHFSPNSLKTNDRHSNQAGHFFEVPISDFALHATGFVPVFHLVRPQTKCHNVQGPVARKLLKTNDGHPCEVTHKCNVGTSDSSLRFGPLFSDESRNLAASRGHRIAFQEEPRHAIE